MLFRKELLCVLRKAVSAVSKRRIVIEVADGLDFTVDRLSHFLRNSRCALDSLYCL